jgi:hypothetical protein
MRRLSPFAVVLLLAVSACSPSGSTSTTTRKEPPPPCHPGCFPAGTAIATPEGLRPIEAIRRGDLVTLISQDGIPTSGMVDSAYHTCNQLVEIRTDNGSLRTTPTQPLCLCDGGFRAAGELTPGDRLWRWDGNERRPARISAVVPAEAEVDVFNLVVGESAIFVADGYLARGKPPPVSEEAK